jgi:transporter family protein
MHAILFAVLAGLCWGIGELFTRSVLHSQQVGPLTAIAVRSTVALPLLWLFWFAATRGWFGLRPEPSIMQADRGTIAQLVLGSGIVAGAAAMIFFYTALSLGEISRVKPVAFALAPATAVILAWIFLGEGMTVRKAVAVAMILAGVVLLTGGSPAQEPADEVRVDG